MSGNRCDVCPSGVTVVVASVPGVPVSCAYCRECLQANAHPWRVLVANTVCIGGLEYADGGWVAMVDATCHRMGRTRAEFEADVAEGLAARWPA